MPFGYDTGRRQNVPLSLPENPLPKRIKELITSVLPGTENAGPGLPRKGASDAELGHFLAP